MVDLTSIEESQQGQCESSKNELQVQKKGLEPTEEVYFRKKKFERAAFSHICVKKSLEPKILG